MHWARELSNSFPNNNPMTSTGFLFVALGAFFIAGAVLNWEWFMNNYKSRLLVKLIGRNAARIIYGIVGFAIAVIGIALLLGMIGTA